MASEVKKESRRTFIKYTAAFVVGAAIIGAGMAAYYGTRPPVEKIVEKPVEKILKETVRETVTVAGSPSVVEKVVEKTVTVSAPTPAPKPKETITFWYLNPEPLRIALVDAIVAKFEKEYPHITVRLEYIPADVSRAKCVSAVQAGTPPDLSSIHDPWVPEFAAMGASEDLTGRINAWEDKGDVTGWDTVTYKDKIYSMPFCVYNDAIFYRTDRLKEVGLPPPKDDWTWDDFLMYAKALTRDVTKDGVIDEYGFGMRGAGLWATVYATYFMYAAGGGLVDERGNVIINSPESLQGFTWYVDLYRKHKVCPPTAPTDSWRGIVEGFGRGVTSTYLHNCGSISEQKHYVGEAKFATVPQPLGPGKRRVSFLHSENVTMYAASKRKDAAWEFLKFWCNPGNMTLFNEGIGMVPPRKSLGNLPKYQQDPHMRAFIKTLDFSVVDWYTLHPAWGGLASSTLNKLLQDCLVGRIGPKEALDKMAEELKKSM